jgi:hypothetical protein
MKLRFAIALFFGLAAGLFAQQQPATEEGRTRFCAVDIYLDSKGSPLAAYQVEFAVTNAAAKITGIEGGEHPAFAQPPFYDPKAMQRERVIIAAFSTEPAAKLPSGKVRVATLHLQVPAPAKPEYYLRIEVAANPEAKRISVEYEAIERSPK